MRSKPALVALLCVLGWSHGGLALDDATVTKKIGALVKKAGVGGSLGIHVVRLSDGTELYRSNHDRPLNPASNLKLLTAAAALRRLGPHFQMWTGFYGRLEPGRVPELVVRGYGDPTLEIQDVVALAEELRVRGVERVDKIVLDGSYFDEQILPPAFDQQPEEASSFRAAISALAVERSAYLLSVRPAASGKQAHVSVWADNYVTVTNEVRTTSKGRAKVHAEQKATEDRKLAVRVHGTIPKRVTRLEYRRRVEDPLSYAGHVIIKALTRAGIGGEKALAYGVGSEGLELLVAQRSQPLSKMLYSVGKWSDNFAAETILKVLGAEAGRPGTSKKGVAVVLEELSKLGVSVEGLTMINGSGLFRGNLVKPSQVTQTLVAMHADPTVASEYIAQLAVAGGDGTLRRRLEDVPEGMVRAKTGTLSDVIALSGYVLGDKPENQFAFSLLFNDIKGHQKQARDLADNIVRLLAH